MKFSPFLEFNQVFANKTSQVMENHHGTVEQVAEAKLQQRLANATISDQAPIPTTLNLQLLHSNLSDSMQKIAVATQNKSSPANNTFNSQSHYIPQMSMPTIPPIPLPIITLNQRESHSVKSSASSNSISNNANPIDITSDRNECNYNLEPTFLNEQTQASRTANSSDCAITSGFKPVSSPVNIPTPSATEHEMRLLPWVDKQTPMHSTRIQRAITQKFVIINAKKTQRDERSYYIHSEQSGNKYTVIIGKIPHCDCPDYQNGNHCKHIIFVMVKVLHVSVTNKLILQQALLSSELMQLFENADEWRNIKKISKVDAKSASMESSLLTDDIMSYAISNKNSSQDLATNDHLPPSLAPPTTASPKEAKLNTRTINNLSSYSSDDLGKLMILLQNETKRRNMESPTKSLESKLNAFKCPLVKYTYPGTQFCDQFVHILALNDLINFTQTFDKSESLHEEPPQMTKEFELQLKSVADHPHILSNIKNFFDEFVIKSSARNHHSLWALKAIVDEGRDVESLCNISLAETMRTIEDQIDAGPFTQIDARLKELKVMEAFTEFLNFVVEKDFMESFDAMKRIYCKSDLIQHLSKQMITQMNAASFGINAESFHCLLMSLISLGIYVDKNVKIRLTADNLKNKDGKTYNVNKMLKQKIESGMFTANDNLLKFADALEIGVPDIVIYLGSRMTGTSMIDCILAVTINDKHINQAGRNDPIFDSEITPSKLHQALDFEECVNVDKEEELFTKSTSLSISEYVPFNNQNVKAKRTELHPKLMAKYDEYKEIAEETKCEYVQETLNALQTIYICNSQLTKSYHATFRNFEFSIICKIIKHIYIRGEALPPSELLTNKDVEPYSSGLSKSWQRILQQTMNVIDHLLTESPVFCLIFAKIVDASEIKDLKITTATLKHIFVDKIGPKLQNNEKRSCFDHNSRSKTFKDVATQFRHIGTVHGITFNLKLQPTILPHYNISKHNVKNGNRHHSLINHLSRLKRRPDEGKKANTIKEKQNTQIINALTDSNKSRSDKLGILLTCMLGQEIILERNDCSDKQLYAKNGIVNLGKGHSMSGFISLSKQKYKYTVDNGSKRLSESSESYYSPLCLIRSGKHFLSEGMCAYLMEIYMKRTSLQDMRHSLSRLYRSILIDQISLHFASNHQLSSQIAEFLENVSDEEFRSEFKNILPKKTGLRNFILRCFASKWTGEIKRALDAALFDGIEIEDDVAQISVNLDGTFASADSLKIDQWNVSGVFMTGVNQNGAPIRWPMAVPVENGENYLNILEYVSKKAIEFIRTCKINRLNIVVCIDDTKTHKNLPKKMSSKIDSIRNSMCLSNDVQVTIILRECGWHAQKRWREIPEDSDKGLLLKIICATHLQSERGNLTIPAASVKHTVSKYVNSFWSSRWKQNVTKVRESIMHYVVCLAKCLDTKYEYDPSEYVYEFPAHLYVLIKHAIALMGPIANHFFGKYIFFHGIPEGYLNGFVELRCEDSDSLKVPWPSLPCFIFKQLCIKLEEPNFDILWQNKKHLFGEYLSIYFFFTCHWNEHDEMPLARFPQFLKRWKLETSDEALMSQLTNRLNTNPKLYGNANTSELLHSFANKNHMTKTTQNIDLKEKNMGLIAKKLCDIKKFKQMHKPDPNWNAWDEVQIINTRYRMIASLRQDPFQNVTALNDPLPRVTVNELIKRGFTLQPKKHANLNLRLNSLNQNKSIKMRNDMVINDEALLFNEDTGIGMNCASLRNSILEPTSNKKTVNRDHRIKKRSFNDMQFDNSQLRYSVLSIDDGSDDGINSNTNNALQSTYQVRKKRKLLRKKDA